MGPADKEDWARSYDVHLLFAFRFCVIAIEAKTCKVEFPCKGRCVPDAFAITCSRIRLQIVALAKNYIPPRARLIGTPSMEACLARRLTITVALAY